MKRLFTLLARHARISVAASTIFFTLAVPAQANLLSVIGDSELFQFNMSASGPPLSSIVIVVPFTIFANTNTSTSAFSDFNGTVPTGIFAAGQTATTVSFGLSSPDADGLFSIRITLTAGGPIQFGTATVSARNAAGALVTGSSIPEPATLALLGLGLSGLALTRRRKPR